MDRFWSYLGGVIGGYAMTQAPIGSLNIPGAEPLLDVVGALAMVVFSVGLVVNGVRSMINR